VQKRFEELNTRRCGAFQLGPVSFGTTRDKEVLQTDFYVMIERLDAGTKLL
jgi:hypothetical protein